MKNAPQAAAIENELVDEALLRLEKLVQMSAAKLASAGEDDDAQLQEREASHRRQMEALQDENIQLREENTALHRELQKVKDAYDTLKQRSDKVAKKLDDTAEQLELMA